MLAKKLLILVYSASYCVAHPPHIIIHKDINKTIIAEDPAGEKTTADVLIHSLAEYYKAKWASDCPSVTSFSDYIKEWILPGSKSDKELKKLRNKRISDFLEFLKQSNHPQYQTINNRFEQLQSKLKDQKSIIFNSCYREIEYLQQNDVTFTFILRTFGKDLERVVTEIQRHLEPDFFSWHGVFKENFIELTSYKNGQSIKFSRDALVDFYQFLKTSGHVALQDDWKTWHDNGEQSAFGKLFPLDFNDKTTVSYFADDNGHPRDGIINPRDCKTNELLDVKTLIESKNICVVNMLEAIENDEYFVTHASELLKNRP